MRIRIVLSEDIHPTNAPPEPPVRHCGDEILGHLEVTTCGKFELELDVSFEGRLCIVHNIELHSTG
jgi:hypothetical protein